MGRKQRLEKEFEAYDKQAEIKKINELSAKFEEKSITRDEYTQLKKLISIYENVEKKPKFMCIIVGHYEAVIQDKETGIYIVPITSLKP